MNKGFLTRKQKLASASFTLAIATLVFASLLLTPETLAEKTWGIDNEKDWTTQLISHEGLKIENGYVEPKEETGSLRTQLRTFKTKRKALHFTVEQSPVWQNWNPIPNLGPVNLRDAPVFLTLGPNDYWLFGRYGGAPGRRKCGQNSDASKPFKPEEATLEGFDIPLQTTPFPNQYDAPGGVKPKLGGYHAWQSRDMIHWVHHGPITEKKSVWMTSAEFADGKAYFYYDFPNDQDPHVYIDSDLFDGLPGVNKGMAYNDPTHGSDSGIIRDLQGNFHLIIEDWSPINARRHAWDSPLAVHAVSPNGFSDFRPLTPPVDHRTTPIGKIGTYKHPHWLKENPERFKTNIAEYAIHEPEQNAYGDWAAIAIGGQYYLFCDYDAADSKSMSVGWFTSSSINQPFTWCDHIGKGHPDPDITFAEGRFYLVTQQQTDYVSPGPWVETVEARIGVDTNATGEVDLWTDWRTLKERYDYTPGFAKQVQKSPARLDLQNLPAGFAYQIELRITDTTENKSKPIIESLNLTFE